MAGFAFTRALYVAAAVLTPGAAPRRLSFGNHAGSLNVDVATLRRLLVDSFDVSLCILCTVNGHITHCLSLRSPHDDRPCNEVKAGGERKALRLATIGVASDLTSASLYVRLCHAGSSVPALVNGFDATASTAIR